MSLKRKPYGSRKTKTRSIDVIIVGGGIAGLFAGYILKQSSPKTNFVIIEKNISTGGRIHLVDFHGKRYPVGAGIGRNTDTYLKDLLNEFKIKGMKDMKQQRYSFEPYFSNEHILEIIHLLKSKRNKILPSDNVYSYCLRILGKHTLSKFITMAGYEDFLNEPAREYFEINNTNVNELFLNFEMFFFDWGKLIHSLTQYIGQKHILTEMAVKEIDMVNLDDSVSSTYFLLKTNHKMLKKQHYFSCNKLIMAVTTDSLQALMPSNLSREIYSHIHCQPFMKVLGKVKKTHWGVAQQCIPYFTVTDNLLRKVFPMDSTKGVYMISYCDNISARELKNITNGLSKKQQIELYEHLLKEAFGTDILLDDLLETFWNCGTHFYDPLQQGSRESFLNRAQLPSPNLIVIGEVVSKTQGWVEGALESVVAVAEQICT